MHVRQAAELSPLEQYDYAASLYATVALMHGFLYWNIQGQLGRAGGRIVNKARTAATSVFRSTQDASHAATEFLDGIDNHTLANVCRKAFSLCNPSGSLEEKIQRFDSLKQTLNDFAKDLGRLSSDAIFERGVILFASLKFFHEWPEAQQLVRKAARGYIAAASGLPYHWIIAYLTKGIAT